MSFQFVVGVICLIKTVLLELSSEISAWWFLDFGSYIQVLTVSHD